MYVNHRNYTASRKPQAIIERITGERALIKSAPQNTQLSKQKYLKNIKEQDVIPPAQQELNSMMLESINVSF